MNTFRTITTTLAISIALLSCKKDDPAPLAVKAATYSNLPADPPSGGYNPTTGQAIGVTKKYTFFSFSTGDIVANTDSATTKWDLAFNGTTILVNSGTSGPGSAGVQVIPGIFSDLTTAPDDGYRHDDKNLASDPYAIKKGSDLGWYHYNPNANIITPVAGRVIVVQTNDGKFAKMEILSYYKDAPEAPTSSSIDRYYTLRYVFQPNGTKKLE